MMHTEFQALAQGKCDYTLKVIPIANNGETSMTIMATEEAIYISKAQAMAFFGLTDAAPVVAQEPKYSAVIDILHGRIADLQEQLADYAAMYEPFKAMVDDVSEPAPDEREPGLWVSADESAAPVDTDLLLTISTGKVVVGMWHSGFGWSWADTDDAADEQAHVTHWRLFPMAAANA